MPELIDTHVHLDDRRLSSQLDQVLAFAAENNVTKMINIGHNRESVLLRCLWPVSIPISGRQWDFILILPRIWTRNACSC